MPRGAHAKTMPRWPKGHAKAGQFKKRTAARKKKTAAKKTTVKGVPSKTRALKMNTDIRKFINARG